MNSQRQSGKNKTASAVFTKETLGVVMVLFATLCLICIITGDAVFSSPGAYVREFLLGVFGYFAYPLTAYAALKGAMLVIDKKFNLSFKRKALSFFAILAVVLFAHVISMGGYKDLSYGEYISVSYASADGVFSAGGVAAAIIAYFLQSLLTVVGSAVVLAVVFGIDAYFLVSDIVKDGKPVSSDREFRSTFVKNETPADSAAEPAQNLDNDFTPQSERQDYKHTAKEQRLFISNSKDFGFKTKREMAKDEGSSFTVDSSTNSLNVSAYANTYSEKYNSELQKKIEYIKTPAKITIEENGTNGDISAARVSEYIPARKDAEPVEDAADSDEIPMIEHENDYKSDAEIRAEAFSARYVAADDAPEAETEENAFSDGLTDTETLSEREDFTAEEPVSEEPAFEEPKFEEPPAPRIREGRARSILFEEKPSYTSRVVPDGNGNADFTRRSADLNSEETEKPEKPPVPINRPYYKPPLDLLETYAPPADAPRENHEERIEIIRRVLEDFHINVEPQGYVQGPTITRYEVKMPAGITVKKVLAYDDDLKMRLQSKAGVRIEAPIPGKDLVGIEVANKTKITVGLKEVLEGAAGQKIKAGSLMFALGKDIVGNSITDNLAKGPHYLVAGATGSGKSVCLNVMIVSMLMRYSPEELRLILIDPKRVGFRKYEHLPHLMIDEIITEPQKAVSVLQWAYKEMERRYDEFAKIEGGLVSDIESYNEIVASDTVAKMPRIVIVVDELADLMETCKKDMETNIRMLAQKARAAGIHLVLATQRPSVDIITGTIKANLPSRIALKVMNFQDSSTILSEGGAEKLLGNGDMLYKNSGMPETERYQGAWISDREINNIVAYIKEKNAAYYDDDLKEFLEKSARPAREETTTVGGDEEDNDGIDDFFLKALWLAITSNSVSIAMLQRRFQIGYARAGGLVDKMERLGFVSGNEGSKARRVLITREEFENRFGTMPDGY